MLLRTKQVGRHAYRLQGDLERGVSKPGGLEN